MKQFFRFPLREAAAFIGDLHQQVLAARVDLQRDIALGRGELECVLQQIGNRRGKQLPIPFDREALLDGNHGESTTLGLRRHFGGRLDLGDKFSNRYHFPS